MSCSRQLIQLRKEDRNREGSGHERYIACVYEESFRGYGAQGAGRWPPRVLGLRTWPLAPLRLPKMRASSFRPRISWLNSMNRVHANSMSASFLLSAAGEAAMRRKAAYVSSPAYTVIPSTTACALPAARERSSVAALHVRFIRLQPKYDHTAGETHKAQPMLVSIQPYRDTVRGHPERDVRFLRGTGKPSVFA